MSNFSTFNINGINSSINANGVSLSSIEGLDSNNVQDSIELLYQKALKTKIPKINNYYPFAESNKYSEKWSPAIAEVYIDNTVYTDSAYHVRVMRVHQELAGVIWTQFTICDSTGTDVFSYIDNTGSDLVTTSFLYNNDYTICAIINWKNVTANTGYNGYNALSYYTLSSDVYNIDNSFIIKYCKKINEMYILGMYSTWEMYGINADDGLVNTLTSQSHMTIDSVLPGDILTISNNSIYRVNYFNDDVFVIQDPSIMSESGSTTVELSTDYIFNKILISRNKDASTSAIVYHIRNFESIGNSIKSAIEYSVKKQKYILPDNIQQFIDYTEYLQNGSVNEYTGTLDTSKNRRSIMNFPITYGNYYWIYNILDTKSSKVISFWNVNGELTRIVQVTDMSSYVLTGLEDEVSVNITLISLYGEINVDRLNEIYFADLGTDGSEVVIDSINGIKIKPTSSILLDKHLTASNPHNITASMIGAITSVQVGSTTISKDVTSVVIPVASANADGIMSAADKAKLDNIIESGSISISGSGVTKNAAAYGFLPTATASENVTALQSAVEGGGTVLIDYPGTYLVNAGILLPSDTTLIFGASVYISMQNWCAFLMNDGAASRSYNENISIYGLNLITNNYVSNTGIHGLNGYLSFFYIKHLVIDGFTLLDGATNPFVIHICTFEDVKLYRLHIEGWKDAVHFGRGSKFVVRDCIFKTYDDPIALNAQDYPVSNPEYGWIEDGIIENCYDLADPDRGTTGFFARLLAGSWSDWTLNNVYHRNGDLCVSDGKIYQTVGDSATGKEEVTSLYQPTHESGTQAYDDGLSWKMVQSNGVGYDAGCKRIYFKNIYLQKPRGSAIYLHFDNNQYSRSYYPNSTPPVQEDLIFENIHVEAEITTLIGGATPVNCIKLINSEIGTARIYLTGGTTEGLTYNTTHVLMIGTTFSGDGKTDVVLTDSNRPVDLKIMGSIIDSSTFEPNVSSYVDVLSNDIGI